jgi:hypothetical protein
MDYDLSYNALIGAFSAQPNFYNDKYGNIGCGVSNSGIQD